MKRMGQELVDDEDEEDGLVWVRLLVKDIVNGLGVLEKGEHGFFMGTPAKEEEQ
ncbi:unnamed protein product [Dovyalis caffra]|uniref:Uncharacterized protein n=1 Tax=Dovyalis caffra TaxID=77055 RepID=A0AAV1SNV5_9ROSI|nr:unnamed protein product [Dovyalis caffra]